MIRFGFYALQRKKKIKRLTAKKVIWIACFVLFFLFFLFVDFPACSLFCVLAVNTVAGTDIGGGSGRSICVNDTTIFI